MRYDDSGIQQDEQAEGYEAARAGKNEILILIRPGEIQYVKRTWNTGSFVYCILYCPEYRVIGHFVCFLMSMKLVFIGLYWHLFFLRRFLRVE